MRDLPKLLFRCAILDAVGDTADADHESLKVIIVVVVVAVGGGG